MPMPQSPTKCPMDSLLRLLMGPWTTYILWVLHSNGPTRFGELKRRVAGISAKMLTERLRMLEESGVVHRDHQPTVPPQVTSHRKIHPKHTKCPGRHFPLNAFLNRLKKP